ncbi:MAG TPA: glycosyltransferase family 4 protein [Jiangellales bacterium]|nr:glycosyltransferase family 4 protein [Jiangellales bacterium]
MTPPVTVVVPGDVETPTGGNVYDRRLCAALTELGVDVAVRPVAGDWPAGGDAGRRALRELLAALPEGATVLGDGLVLDRFPEVVAPHAERLRLVSLVHLPLADETGLDPAEAARLRESERRALAACRAVVVTGSLTVTRVQELGVPAARVHLVEPGTDPAPPAPGRLDGGSLLCLAAIVPRKGQLDLVDALAGLAHRPWQCRLVGPVDRNPPYAEAVREAVRRHGLRERVEVCGVLDDSELDETWAATDLLVLPSYWETYGMVLAEALARGVPVVTTTGSEAERTAAGAGLLVPPGDSDALRAALERWLSEPTLRAELAARAREAGRALPTWDTAARRMAAVLVGVGS